jgi:hypothetical protein
MWPHIFRNYESGLALYRATAKDALLILKVYYIARQTVKG